MPAVASQMGNIGDKGHAGGGISDGAHCVPLAESGVVYHRKDYFGKSDMVWVFAVDN